MKIEHDSCYFDDWITRVEAEWYREEGHHRNLNADEAASAYSRLSYPTLCLVFLVYFYLVHNWWKSVHTMIYPCSWQSDIHF